MEVIDNSTIHGMEPGALYRPEVFGPEDVSRDDVAYFMNEGHCRTWVLTVLHPHGAHCPGCAGLISGGPSLQSFWKGSRVKCCRCGKFFTALTGTFLSGVHLSYAGVIMMAMLIDARADDSQIARLLNMSTEGVRGWRQRFANTGLSRGATIPTLLSGVGISESRDAANGARVPPKRG
jgi:transposase-like protein